MKRQISILAMMAIFVTSLLFSCKKDDDGLKGKFTADEAKVEIASASQDVQESMGAMMTNPSMESLMFLMQLLDMDFDDDEWKTSFKSTIVNDGQLSLMATNRLIRESLDLKLDDFDPEDGGVYTFNFSTDEFDLTNPNVTYLMLIYPANDAAYYSQTNNAELKVEDIEFVEIEYDDGWDVYTEELLTKIKVGQKIDNQTVMTCNYNATFNDDGLPLSMSFNMSMAPYSIVMSQSGSGVNYNSKLSFKEGNNVLVAYDLDFKYNSQMDDIVYFDGYFQLTPVKFQGDMNIAAMENCGDYDVNCMNNNIDIQLIQTDKNKIIGDIEFRLYTDPTYGDQWVEPVIVYADGTWEWLFVALGMDIDDWKSTLMR